MGYCQHLYCQIHASYGLPGTSKRIFCKEHAPLDYIDVSHKRCAQANCQIRPNYGLSGTSEEIFCKQHAPLDYIDVKNKRCTQLGCHTSANYGLSGYQPEYCAKHKTNEMVLHPRKRKREQIVNCQYCAAEINYNEQFCSSCKRYIELGNKTVKSHTKELTIKMLLKTNFENEFVSHDMIIDNACSKRRPDFVLNAPWGSMIVEVDEFQHMRNNYPCACEISRMKQIYFDCGVQHLLFVRYNPDKYKLLETTLRCESKNNREKYLVRYIKEQLVINNKPSWGNLGVVYLFYDGFSRDVVEIETINPYSSSSTDDNSNQL